MYPVLRAARVFAAAFRAPRLAPLGTSAIRMRVWPGDLDLNLHLNNGRYLTLMDLGRFDLVIRAGLLPVLRRNRWGPLVASLAIRYRRALGPMAAFELRTRVIGWDDRWIFLEQGFLRGGEVAALAVVKALLAGPGGRVPPGAVFAALGWTDPSPPIPEAVRRWEEAEHELQGSPAVAG